MRSETVAGATVRTLLQRANERLQSCLADAPAHTADTPYLDAVILLGHAMRLSRESLLARMPDPVGSADASLFLEFLNRRCTGEPVAYILGQREFYGREFAVGPSVLVPRPETELLVEAALDRYDQLTGWAGQPRGARETGGSPGQPLHLHDTCTGTGCVAITIALERPELHVTGSDESEAALATARENASVLAGKHAPAFYRGDLLDALPATEPSPEIITANPPYLSDNEYAGLRDQAWAEPPGALVGGEDGLDIVRRLVAQCAARLAPGGWLLLEVGSTQGGATVALLEQSGFRDVEVLQDLAGHDRVVQGKR